MCLMLTNTSTCATRAGPRSNCGRDSEYRDRESGIRSSDARSLIHDSCIVPVVRAGEIAAVWIGIHRRSALRGPPSARHSPRIRGAAGTFPHKGGRGVSFVLLVIAVVAGCGREQTANAPAQQQSQPALLPGQAAPIRKVELAIPAAFDEAGLFSEGLAPVRMGAKFGST